MNSMRIKPPSTENNTPNRRARCAPYRTGIERHPGVALALPADVLGAPAGEVPGGSLGACWEATRRTFYAMPGEALGLDFSGQASASSAD
ncbi:MAG: hypothetical protein IPL70_10935 [Uliginosibacterium sp.]|nr:hypothetical protein [Uliginosibacterium sp.]